MNSHLETLAAGLALAVLTVDRPCIALGDRHGLAGSVVWPGRGLALVLHERGHVWTLRGRVASVTVPGSEAGSEARESLTE
jgi:hypothetical protein